MFRKLQVFDRGSTSNPGVRGGRVETCSHQFLGAGDLACLSAGEPGVGLFTPTRPAALPWPRLTAGADRRTGGLTGDRPGQRSSYPVDRSGRNGDAAVKADNLSCARPVPGFGNHGGGTRTCQGAARSGRGSPRNEFTPVGHRDATGGNRTQPALRDIHHRVVGVQPRTL